MWNKLKKFNWDKIVNCSVVISFFLYILIIFFETIFNNLFIFYADDRYFFVLFIIFLALGLIKKQEKYLIIFKKEISLKKISLYLFVYILSLITLNRFSQTLFINRHYFELTIVSLFTGFFALYFKEQKLPKSKHRITKGLLLAIDRILNYLKLEKNNNSIYSRSLLSVTILFIFSRICLPVIYKGSYIDETAHFFSGLELFKTGNFAKLYYGEFYNRGAYVSFLTGLFFKFFGQSILSAKMVSSLIGIANYFLVIVIAKKIIKKNWYVVLLAIIYTINPWTVFNDFYVRMYIFYELFLLLSILLFIKLSESIQNNKKISILFTFGILIINSLNFFFSHDEGLFLILLENLCFFTYLYLLYFDHFFSKLKTTKVRKYFKYLILILFALVFSLFLNAPAKITELFTANLQFTAPDNYKYIHYFFNIDLLFTIFFLLSLYFIKNLKKIESVIVLTGLILFFVHLISSSDLQMMRVILYLFPLYFIIAIYSFSKFKINNFLFLLISILMITTLLFSYPKDFLKGPYIPYEVNYKDYEVATSYIEQSFNLKKIVLVSSQPQINIFLKLHFKNVYLLRNNKKADYNKSVEYYDKTTGLTRSSLTGVVVIDNYQQMMDIVTSTDDVVIFMDTDLYNWTTPETRKLINLRFTKIKSFKGVDVYMMN